MRTFRRLPQLPHTGTNTRLAQDLCAVPGGSSRGWKASPTAWVKGERAGACGPTNSQTWAPCWRTPLQIPTPLAPWLPPHDLPGGRRGSPGVYPAAPPEEVEGGAVCPGGPRSTRGPAGRSAPRSASAPSLLAQALPQQTEGSAGTASPPGDPAPTANARPPHTGSLWRSLRERK